MSIQCQLVDNSLSLADKKLLWPQRQTSYASGFDLASAHREELTINPHERILVSTGIKLAVPQGLEGQVRSRSGLALKHGVVVLNSPGTIDADYRGEIRVILFNLAKEPFVITFGMRIAQLVIAPISLLELNETESLSASRRGEAGFGSTGLLGSL